MIDLKHIILFLITLYWTLKFNLEPLLIFIVSFICGIIVNSFQFNNYTFKYDSNIAKETFKLTLINMLLIIIIIFILNYKDDF